MSLPQILFLVPILLWAQGVVLHFSLSICLNFLHFSLSVIVLVESELKTTSIGLAIGRLKNQLWFPGEENEKTVSEGDSLLRWNEKNLVSLYHRG